MVAFAIIFSRNIPLKGQSHWLVKQTSLCKKTLKTGPGVPSMYSFTVFAVLSRIELMKRILSGSISKYKGQLWLLIKRKKGNAPTFITGK